MYVSQWEAHWCAERQRGVGAFQKLFTLGENILTWWWRQQHLEQLLLSLVCHSPIWRLPNAAPSWLCTLDGGVAVLGIERRVGGARVGHPHSLLLLITPPGHPLLGASQPPVLAIPQERLSAERSLTEKILSFDQYVLIVFGRMIADYFKSGFLSATKYVICFIKYVLRSAKYAICSITYTTSLT